MEGPTGSSPPRCAVVDLGSNSVRLVVFEGRSRNPVAIFNEKAVLRLGRGLQETGRLNEDGVADAITVLGRYQAVARAMGAAPMEILATAAVREASNGPEFVRVLNARMPEVPIRVLTGPEEAAMSASGLLCGIPGAEGVLGDIGGGSLEVVRISGGGIGLNASLPLGVIRLSERAGGDPVRARAIAEEALSGTPWLREGAGLDLYLVGGAWRALARIHIAQTGYPLHLVHHYTLGREEARDLTGVIAGASRRALERIPGVPRRRIDDLPFAAVVMRRLLRATGARRVVFSANGLREGWFMKRLPEEVRAADPMRSAGRELAAQFGRDPDMPPALIRWTAPLFSEESAEALRLRETACWMSDIGSHEHPEYRAEQAYLRVLRQPGIGLDHHARAFLGLTLAVRYEAEPDMPWLSTARMLLDVASARQAEVLGAALRLAYTLSGGTPELLAGTALRVEGRRIVLLLTEGSGVFAGEGVVRRLERLAESLAMEAVTEIVPGAVTAAG